MDKAVIMNMTGDEFKRLMEQKDPNEIVNTLPEIMDLLRGIRDNETLEDYIKRVVASMFSFDDNGTVRITLPDNFDDYEEIADVSSLPEGDAARAADVILSAVVNALGNDKPYYNNILVADADISETVTLKALNGITLKGVQVSGGKGPSNGKVTFAAKSLTLKDITASENTTLYNAFEGYQRTDDPDYKGIEKVTAERLDINCPSLTHNIINVYTPASGARILVKDSKFNLTVDNTNPLRLANYLNAENVTVTFENCEWNYEESITKNDWRWAGLVIFQPAAGDVALSGDLSKLKTWTFNFINCKYNGQKATENNFGQHSQVFYLYNIGRTQSVEDPVEKGITLKFK